VDPASLRPLRVGEILDTALTIYRQRAGTMIRAVVLVIAPVQVLTAIVNLSAPGNDVSTIRTDPTTGLESTSVDWSLFLGFVAATLAVAALGVIASQLATAACLKSVSGAYLGSEPDWKESLRFARGHVRSLIWLTILYGLGLGVGFLLCVAPAVYLYGAWAVATPVLLLEGKKGRRALGRSRQLVKGRWGPTFLAIVLGAILAAIVQGVLQGLLLGLLVSGANDVVRAVASAVAGTLGSALVTPFTAAVAVVLYFDLRVRKEGFDLELLAERVGIAPPEGTTFTPSPIRPAPPTLDGGDDEPPFWPPPPGWRPRE
jgi:hypothetical protein